uniref:DDE-1 domain-containing protein n=1 Tax=Electrophorus electricus TaxID=8005 RepID=A0AAY5EK17_ELEEL
MPPKRPAPSKASGKEVKRPKATVTLQKKVELLDMPHKKQNFAAIACHYGINESTVCYIRKNEAAIRCTLSSRFRETAKNVSSVRNEYIVRMALALWINDCRKKYIRLDGNFIKEKARNLYQQFSTEEGTEPQCSSQGPKKAKEKPHQNIRLLSALLYGEAASTDTEAAEKYPDTLRAIVREKAYKPEQVFNMDETGLFWKKIQSSGVKAQKDRVTLIMCGNATGHMLKPGLIYKSANPKALKNKNKNLLPQCFVPQVKEYLLSLGMEFKVLLLMDNAVGHHVDMYSEGVQIEFLPPNTTSLIQPMDQGMIHAFRALYTKISLQQNHFTASYTADDYIKKETFNACWKKLWPDCVQDYKGFSTDKIQHAAVDKATRLAKLLGGEGFDNITEEEVNTLIDAEPLTDADLEELTKTESKENVEAELETEAEEEQGLTLKCFSEILKTARNVQTMVESWDPHTIQASCSTMNKIQQWLRYAAPAI